MVLMLPHINKQSNIHVDYWEISSALSTQHLLSVISLTNTLMSMSNATFVKHHRYVCWLLMYFMYGNVGVNSIIAKVKNAVWQNLKQNWLRLTAEKYDLVNCFIFCSDNYDIICNSFSN